MFFLQFFSLFLHLVSLGIIFLLFNKVKKNNLDEALKSIEKNQIGLEKLLREENSQIRQEINSAAHHLREELNNTLFSFSRALSSQLQDLTQMNEQKLEKIRETVENKMQKIQDNNNQQLELMRTTVDEKLHATLEKRLGESFQLVSNRLEQVHKGLGEMQSLATGVGDLKRIMSNVKTRGIWGEIQLGNILEQTFTKEQYAANIITKPDSNDRVEFALKLPGQDNPLWLPIDAKFPQEDYQRLLDAQEAGNAELAEVAAKALENRVKGEAKDISTKYLAPPHTTDFAILFLPIEGLYAEVLRRPGLYDTLLTDYRIAICGPTTLSAFLTSLSLGFRTLAIEKRSSEVWDLLGAVKGEFSKFGDLLDKTQKKLQETSNVIKNAATRTRAIERKLRAVEKYPAEQTNTLLDINEEITIDSKN